MATTKAISLRVVTFDFPSGVEVIAGQGFFSPLAVEDLHRILATSAPTAQFGIGMVEGSSGIVRRAGNDDELVGIAARTALDVAAGHFFIIALRNAFPIQVVAGVKNCSCIASVFCATGNPTALVVADTGHGAAVLGAADGVAATHIESETDISDRRAFLRRLGYLEAPSSGHPK